MVSHQPSSAHVDSANNPGSGCAEESTASSSSCLRSISLNIRSTSLRMGPHWLRIRQIFFSEHSAEPSTHWLLSFLPSSNSMTFINLIRLGGFASLNPPRLPLLEMSTPPLVRSCRILERKGLGRSRDPAISLARRGGDSHSARR